MNFQFDTHWEMLVITPAIGITVGQCDDALCDASHWRLTLSWFFWTLEISW